MAISLVTGGAGFIGSHVVNSLWQLGHEVIVLDDLSVGFEQNINSRATFMKGSICDYKLVNKLFSKYKFDYVYHLAAYAAEGLSHFIRRFNYNNNLIGSVNLINASVKNKVKCFVFTSSIAVYGSQVVPMTETATPQPEDPYGVAKYAIEMDLKAAYKMFGLEYVIFRPHNVYGPMQNIGDRYRNVIGIFMNQLLQDIPLTIFGDGSQTRAFSHIDDVAPHIANCVNIKEAYNEIFNIGGDTEYSVKELADTVMKVMGIDGEIRNLETRNEVVHAYADHEKAEKVFGIDQDSLITLEAGLKEMADWVKKKE
ncbi:NAD-dependent epimerase/dehydratase family protein [Mangrovivirga cuniculi]|uniref:NAD-dependent epimerase/dehydratase family protein n=1 Tax=Mangrovivirga cuniculi TaxID=2715131 RepID=UPI001C30B2F3|nr:NAD-dependent epimerase/dehydratase family protein [Mangrovivirga cuniculi]